ncbi:MAG: peptide transporter permease [Herbinix sp.]|jgi:peptide/nickel transport system permease protein/oligopeptide transport system permease protein|nr:peptide transporter permease [Herbinix sp.]
MKYIIKKIITLIMTLLLVSIFTFTAFQLIPGDSATAILGMEATEDAKEALREELGLNKSIPERYLNWLLDAIKGDFGTSIQYSDMPVHELIRDRLTVTVYLALISFAFIIIISIPLGILTSKKKDGFLDRVITFFTQLSMAVPPFVLGIMIILLFGIILKWFTPGKFVHPSDSLFGFFRFIIFPAIAVAIPKVAMLVKFLRSSILRQKDMDYVRTAKSKGMKEDDILYHHVLKNALIPVITFLAMMLADLLAGIILIEQVFNLPGLGRQLVVAIGGRDFSVVQAIILYIAAVVVVINFIVDILYQWIDPRVAN